MNDAAIELVKIELKVYHNWPYKIVGLLSVFLSFIIAMQLVPVVNHDYDLLHSMYFIIIFVLLWYLIDKILKYICVGEVGFIISSTRLEIIWLKPFLFKEGEKIQVRWEELEKIEQTSNRHFEMIRLTTKGKKYSFHSKDVSALKSVLREIQKYKKSINP